MLPGCRHFSQNNNSNVLFDLLCPELSTIFTSPWHDTDFTWSLVHHTIFDKLLGKISTFFVFRFSNHCWGIAGYFLWLIKVISVQNTPSSQWLSKLFRSAHERFRWVANSHESPRDSVTPFRSMILSCQRSPYLVNIQLHRKSSRISRPAVNQRNFFVQ